MRDSWSPLAVALLALLMIAGCGTAAAPGGAGVGAQFASAVRASDWSRACGYLAPETRAELEKSSGMPCAAALAEESPPDPGPLDGSATFGAMTQLRYQEDTIFLARFRSGWKVMALECSPVSGHPYDCRIQGG